MRSVIVFTYAQCTVHTFFSPHNVLGLFMVKPYLSLPLSADPPQLSLKGSPNMQQTDRGFRRWHGNSSVLWLHTQRRDHKRIFHKKQTACTYDASHFNGTQMSTWPHEKWRWPINKNGKIPWKKYKIKYCTSSYLVMVIPEYVSRRFRTVFYRTRQVDRWALVDVYIWTAQYGGRRYWNAKEEYDK